MEREKAEGSASEIEDNQRDLAELEKGLKAPLWRDRAKAAQVAASTLLNDGRALRFRSKKGLSAGPGHVVDVYDMLLRQLLHELALKDSQWQVRVAAVESAATILAATQTAISADLFAEYVQFVLAACLDVQPEVQLAASKYISQEFLRSPIHDYHVIVTQLCDRFVEAATASNELPSKNANLSTKLEIIGLDNLPDGDVLLTAITAAICFQLLSLPTSDGESSQEPDRIPLIAVVVAVALEDANRRHSRMIAKGYSKLLRCLGKPLYRNSLLMMFNSRTPFYLSGSGIAKTYQNTGIINEDTCNLLKTVKAVTLLNGLSLAFEPSQADDCLPNVVISDNWSASQPNKVSGLSQEELIALPQILEMLQVPDDLTKAWNNQDKESKTAEFMASAMPLLSICSCIIMNANWELQDQPLENQLVENIVLCCATFAGGDEEYGGGATWTSRQLRELSMTLLTFLSDVVHPDGVSKVSTNRLPSTSIWRLISEQVPSLLPRIKQVIQDSSGSSGGDVLHKLSPEGSVGLSIIAAYQMQWVLRQLEHPNLGPHCQLVMPCVLTALDHFSPEVKRQAMGSCIHLAQNMNRTELQWYKDVILDAVARSLVGCGDLWPVAVKMAVTTVTRIEMKNPRGSWWGRIFSEMLGELERQQDDQGRRVVWLREISPYMEAMGLFLVAYFKRLLPLLFYWLHAPDDVTCILTLTKLQTLITFTWPRIPAHVQRIWKELMHTYQESTNRKLSSKIQAAVFENCKLLHSCAGPTFEAVWQNDANDKSIDELLTFLKEMKTDHVAGLRTVCFSFGDNTTVVHYDDETGGMEQLDSHSRVPACRAS